jgi:hypothetical protein
MHNEHKFPIQQPSLPTNTPLQATQVARGNLYAQSHDRVDYIVVILLQCLDSLLSGHACLSHDQLDILVLKTRGVDFLSIILIIVLLVITLIDSFALSVVMSSVIMSRVVMSGVIVLLLSRKLLGSRCLSLGIEILDLGLTENTAEEGINICILQ